MISHLDNVPRVCLTPEIKCCVLFLKFLPNWLLLGSGAQSVWFRFNIEIIRKRGTCVTVGFYLLVYFNGNCAYNFGFEIK